jgi:predicted deacylase
MRKSTKNSKNLERALSWVWLVNALGLLALMVIGGLYWLNETVTASNAPQMIVVEPPQLPATATQTQPAPTAFYPRPSPGVDTSATPEATPTEIPTPEFTQKDIIIGYSVEGRPLQIFVFGEGHTRRLIVAGIHGGYEGNTVKLAFQLIDYLRSHPETIPPDITLYILPNLNPDGYARGGAADPDARANAHGVDLNRNWPYNWQADWDRKGCFNSLTLSGGKFAASEPETVNLMLFINLYKPDALISYHSASLGIFAGGLPTIPDSESLAEAIAKVTTYRYPPVDTGCYYTGNLADWASSNGIAAVDIELSDHLHTDFDMNLRVLNVFLQWQR